MDDKSNVYLPRVRSYSEPDKEYLISKSPEGVDTKLANTVEDPIVVNNIAYSEFDYTEDPFDESE